MTTDSASGVTPDSGPTLSVVVPAYNEEAVLPLLASRLRPALDELGDSYEVVVDDDGSSDHTPAVLLGLARTWPQLRTIRLRRNCGHQAALSAGLDRAFGEYVVSIDADLQDPPEVIRRCCAWRSATGSTSSTAYAPTAPPTRSSSAGPPAPTTA